ncbi:MAG: amidohydrolase family protein [Dehalococcoidia bacterium]
MIVDIHTHIFPPRMVRDRAALLEAEPAFAELYAAPRATMATAEDLLASMERARVDVSVAAGFWWRDPALVEEHARYLVDVAAASGGRIVPFVPGFLDALPDEVRRGAAGVGEVRIADPAAFAEVGALPLLAHCSEEVGHAYGGKGGGLTPGALWALLEGRPETRVIAAHWGGGFPFYALMPEVREIVEAGGVVFDSAASSLLYAPEVFSRVIEVAGLDAVCWGSDFPLREQAVDRAAVEAALPDEAARAAVLGGNAARFLRLEGQ